MTFRERYAAEHPEQTNSCIEIIQIQKCPNEVIPMHGFRCPLTLNCKACWESEIPSEVTLL